MAKCLCCCGGNWTLEEDWRWCPVTPSARGNPGTRKTETVSFHSQICVCARTRARQKQLIYLLTSIFSFDITQTAMKQKLVGEGRGVKTEQHLQPACDAWPAEGRQADETRSNANTKRVSGVSLIITRHKVKMQTLTQTVHWLKCWQRIHMLHMLNKICWLVYTGVKGRKKKNDQHSFITNIDAEVSPAAYQTVVWVQAAVVSRLGHVRWRSCKHSPVTGLTDPIGRVPRVRRTVGTVWGE